MAQTHESETNFSALENALQSLKDALNPPPANDRERDGAIQRFEYTFELSWKVAMRVLREAGIESTTPKAVIRDLAKAGWISNPEEWLGFLKARNLTSHAYKELYAREVFDKAQTLPQACESLLVTLKKQSKS
jgi:nucleotidyltransferase substrate binding protein (TIGR01987 family)